MASYTYFAIDLGDDHALGCKCCRFSSGTDLPIPKKLSNDEIGKLARSFAHEIFADWGSLNAILKRYEDLVQRRWMKKNEKKRQALLLEAWPDMAPTHRPDFVGFRKAYKNHPRSRTMQSKAYLWPYINLEDLLQRHLLLMFINSRGRTLPDKFISVDIEAAHLGAGWHFFPDDIQDGPSVLVTPDRYRDGITVIGLHDAHDPRSYGRLEHRNGMEPVKKSSFMTAPGLGLLGLEIQQGIYSFLLKCVKLILHDLEPARFFLEPSKLAPPVPSEDVQGYHSLSTEMLEAPYRVPQLPNLDRIRSLVSARRSAAEDHLWLLRDDPGYFLDTLMDWKEHDIITVKHTCARCYNVVAARMLGEAFTYFLFWDHISRCLDRLAPLEVQIKRADASRLRLAKQDEVIWAELLEVVDFLIREPINALRIGVPPSPRLRHCFIFPVEPMSGDERKDLWRTKRKISDSERRVTGLVFAIVDKEKRDLHSLNHIIQELQYMMETDQASTELIDPWINSQIADLALLSELKLRIEGLQPVRYSGCFLSGRHHADKSQWHTGWKAHKVNKIDPVKYRVEEFFSAASREIRDNLIDLFKEFKYDLLTNPLNGDLDYPASKAYTKANVEQMRKAEMKLDEFWTTLDVQLRVVSSGSLYALLRSRVTETREKHRTPLWKEPLKIAATPKGKPVLKQLSTNIVNMHAASTSKRNISVRTLRKKIKTRGVAASPAVANPRPCTPEVNAGNGADPHPTITTIAVSKHAFKVFDALVPAPTNTSHQRSEVAWNELLAAMDEIGMQPEKLYGSVWVFKPRGDGKMKVDVTRSISFHEPKEVRHGHKISSMMVRTFGRRLKHAYGWWDGMFVRE